jgi:hypothetical protein
MSATPQSASPQPRRRWRIVLPTVIVGIAAVLWTGGWFFAVSKAEDALGRWRAREAQSGRIHKCARESIGGYPFRIEVYCTDGSTELANLDPPLLITIPGLVAAAQVYQPTLLLTEYTAPLRIGPRDGKPQFIAKWRLAQSSARGMPSSQQRVSFAVDGLNVEQLTGGAILAKAQRMELHARLLSGTLRDNPVIESVIRLNGATVEGFHPLAAKSIDADIAGVVSGLRDIGKKSVQERLKEFQANNGRVEITKARVQLGEAIAIGTGKVGLTAEGHVDGQFNITATGLETLLPLLGLDKLIMPRKGAGTLGALDRIMPGLGNAAAGAGLMAALAVLGKRKVLEGKPAFALVLRFSDGAVFLGPLKVGQTQALF